MFSRKTKIFPGEVCSADCPSREQEMPNCWRSYVHQNAIYCSAQLGAGVLLFPYCFSTLGLIPSTIAFLGVSLLMCFVSNVLAHASELSGQKSFQASLKVLVHPKLALPMESTMCLYLFGTFECYTK